MKIDELIRQRKDQLDVESPPPLVWEEVAKGWKQPENASFQWWKVAAIVFLCLSTALLIQNRLLQNQVNDLATLSDFSEDYARVEQQYITQVGMLEEATSIETLAGVEDYQWVFDELELLEEINVMYRSDIGKVNEEQLVRVLIDYYEKKIKLLRKLELELERNSNRTQNETTTTDHIRI